MKSNDKNLTLLTTHHIYKILTYGIKTNSRTQSTKEPQLT